MLARQDVRGVSTACDVEQQEHDLKILLLPKDPNDGKNANVTVKPVSQERLVEHVSIMCGSFPKGGPRGPLDSLPKRSRKMGRPVSRVRPRLCFHCE